MIKEALQTKNKSPWKNTCEYIVLHHTATKEGTIKWVLRQLTVGPVSCHFVVDTNGDIYKIGELTDILWHAGVSEWKGKENMNKYSVGIEVIWPLPGFTNAQRKSVQDLVSYLLKELKLTPDKLIRHKDIAPGRKTDIDDSFWRDAGHASWEEYQNTFIQKPNTMASKFKEVYDRELQEYKDKTGKVKPQKFSDLSGDQPATIEDVKYLIEIANLRG